MLFFKPNIAKLEHRKDVIGLVKALRHRSIEARDVMSALARIPDPRAIAALIVCLDHTGLDKMAGMSLWCIGAAAVDPLIQAMRIPSISRDVIDILTNIGDQRARDAFSAIVSNDNEDQKVRSLFSEATNEYDRKMKKREELRKESELEDKRQNERAWRLKNESCATDGHEWSNYVVGGGFHYECLRCGARKHVHSGNISHERR